MECINDSLLCGSHFGGGLFIDRQQRLPFRWSPAVFTNLSFNAFDHDAWNAQTLKATASLWDDNTGKGGLLSGDEKQ